MFEARFTLAYEPDEALYHVKELSRREMFEQVSHGSKSGTKKLLQMLPGLHSEDGAAGSLGFPPFAAPATQAAEHPWKRR